MKKTIIAGLFSLTALTAAAQHDHHNKQTENKKDSVMLSMEADTMPHMQHTGALMSHAFSRNLPMNRNSSGTAWLPDEAPMYGYMVHSKKWMYMFHGNVFLRYTNQDVGNAGSRGDDQFDIPNWFMAMGQTAVGKRGLFRFSAMLSFDILTMGGNGYPLLFQSGETWKDQPLIDRQHPHDLFAELSVAYTHMISKDADVFIYLGYPGEPAISAPTFMHRPSSMYNPDAPLGHHWQDATHITFGVATLGVRYKDFKLEGSSFTGREPDEDRYNFDKARFDSWAARLSWNPSREWALQVSQAFVKSPEILQPDEDVNKTTASVVHAKRFTKDKMINWAAVWGYNRIDRDHKEHSFLLESVYNWQKNAVYGRYEWVEKSVEELDLDEDIYGHDAIFPVNAFTLGINRQLLALGKTNISIGTQATLFISADELKELYGKTPWAFQAFIRIYPALMR